MKLINRFETLIVVIGFGILVSMFFYQTIFNGRLPIPSDTLVGLYHPWRDVFASTNPRGVPFKNFLITDPIRQQIPWRKIVIDQWKSGSIPKWNPFSFAGMPIDANIQAAAFYLFNIFFWIFRFPIAWTLLVMMQPFIAGILLFAYLRHQKLSRVAAFIGAIAWSFSGFSVAWLTWGTIMQAAMWLPLLLFSLDVLIEDQVKGRQLIKWTGLSILSIILMISAGHSQIALYGMVTAAIYAYWKIENKRHVHQQKRMLRSRLAVVGLLAIFIGMPIWMPLIRVFPQTVRGLQGGQIVQGWFLPWQHIAQFVAPDFFGNPATLNYWGVWNYGEFVGYIGILPLLFALGALFSGSVASFWSYVILASLFFMLPNPITIFISQMKIPLVGSLQPTRLMMVVDLSLSILAAYGFDLWKKADHRIVRASMFIVGSLCTLWIIVFVSSKITVSALWIENMMVAKHNLIVPSVVMVLSIFALVIAKRSKGLGTSLCTICILSIVVIDLFRFGWKFIPFTEEKYFFPNSKIITFLQQRPKPFRIASVDDRIFPPNVSAYYGIETIEGYDPLALTRYENLLVASERNKPDLQSPSGFNRIYTAHNISSKIFPLFNVQYILSLETLNTPYLKLVFQEGLTKVYENERSLPRVYLAEYIDFVSDDSARAQITALFDAKNTTLPAVVEKKINILSLPLSGDESVHIDSYDSNKIKIIAHTVNPRLLVVLNSFDMGWKVKIDGKPIEPIRVNYLFTGVVVPVGTHNIELVY